jgi:hypothetical protein
MSDPDRGTGGSTGKAADQRDNYTRIVSSGGGESLHINFMLGIPLSPEK